MDIYTEDWGKKVLSLENNKSNNSVQPFYKLG
ncbi:unknown [Prevotella sp. CAG:1092]|nr:unknown [Prevotella sp. CAG:1092]